MVNVPYSIVVKRLLEVVPEVCKEYDEEAASWRGERPHPHIVYGSVFPRFLERVISDVSMSDDEAIPGGVDRSFDLIEELARSDDFETRCLVEASVLESLLGEVDGWRRFSRFFRPSTMRMARRVMARFEGAG